MAAVTMPGGRPLATQARWAASTWDLLLAITLRDLRVKYRGTVLSYFWWLARPLALSLVLYFALGRVLKLDVENYAVFLLAALFPWFWFQGTLGAATGAFIANAGLVKKVRFPRPILPLSTVLAAAFEFVVTLPVLVIVVVASGIDPEWTWVPGMVVLVTLQLVLLAGLGPLVASINVFFRDLAPGLEAFLTLLFYVTPIIYPLERVPGGVKPFLFLNPMVPIVDGWRDLFLEGDFPGLALWPAALFAFASLAVALAVLKSTSKSLADAL